MSFRVFRRAGRSQWYVSVSGCKPNGERLRDVQRRAPGTTRREAEAYARQVEAEILAGTFERPSETLGTFWPDYLAYCRSNNRPSTYAAKEKAGRLHILPALGDRKLADLGKQQIEEFKAPLMKTHAPHTVNNVLGYLHRALTLAVEYQKLNRAPETGLVEYQEIEAAWLEPEEQARFAEAAAHWPERQALLVTLLDTGFRIGEALGLRHADVDFARHIAVVRRTRVAIPDDEGGARFGPAKEGGKRDVALTDRALEALRSRRSLNELAFTAADGTGLTHSQVKRWVAQCARRAGIAKHVTNHSLRHSRTAVLVMAGCAEAWIMAQLGWTTRAVLRRYTHLSPTFGADEVRRAEAFLTQNAERKADHGDV